MVCQDLLLLLGMSDEKTKALVGAENSPWSTGNTWEVLALLVNRARAIRSGLCFFWLPPPTLLCSLRSCLRRLQAEHCLYYFTFTGSTLCSWRKVVLLKWFPLPYLLGSWAVGWHIVVSVSEGRMRVHDIDLNEADFEHGLHSPCRT